MPSHLYWLRESVSLGLFSVLGSPSRGFSISGGHNWQGSPQAAKMKCLEGTTEWAGVYRNCPEVHRQRVVKKPGSLTVKALPFATEIAFSGLLFSLPPWETNSNAPDCRTPADGRYEVPSTHTELGQLRLVHLKRQWKGLWD